MRTHFFRLARLMSTGTMFELNSVFECRMSCLVFIHHL